MNDNMTAEQKRQKEFSKFLATARFTLGSRLWLDQWTNRELAEIRNAIQPGFNDELKLRGLGIERGVSNDKPFSRDSSEYSWAEPEPPEGA